MRVFALALGTRELPTQRKQKKITTKNKKESEKVLTKEKKTKQNKTKQNKTKQNKTKGSSTENQYGERIEKKKAPAKSWFRFLIPFGEWQ